MSAPNKLGELSPADLRRLDDGLELLIEQEWNWSSPADDGAAAKAEVREIKKLRTKIARELRRLEREGLSGGEKFGALGRAVIDRRGDS